MNFKKYVTLFWAVTLCVGFFSCDDDVDGEEPQPADTTITSNFFVLNRGNNGANNASIAYYNAASGTLNDKFYEMLQELVEFGIRRYERNYKNTYKQTDLVLYQKYTYEDCDIMSGIDFLQDVKNNCLSDYDGYIERVFVDGYKSNLGLLTDNLQSGDFLVTEDVWEKLCVEHDIQISWCNK